ncbi:MAG: thioredoxin [Candidatus Omnitrophica bacterium]|nr:thioredoxin [Candidatus Omnitrophota bacterium]MCM8808654.1 thioredoxin [Candidatus Omnitrophota bacterium]MCM8810421.1 thioredoxin [Candidatus Omnitrophota bacterium]MCM8833541.1 thioredoxin [Candidatus Omnitrophota bacterium]
MEDVLILNIENFDEIIKNNEKVVVDFWASWCMPCKIVAPVFENLAKKYKGSIVFAKVNVDENPDIAAKFDIMSIPNFVIFKNGEKIGQIVGAMPENVLEEKILNCFK